MPSSHHVLSALLVTLLTFSYHTLSADAEATCKCSYKSGTSNCFVLYPLLAKLMSVVCVEHVYCCLICEAIFLLLTNFQYQLGVWPTHIKDFVSEFPKNFPSGLKYYLYKDIMHQHLILMLA